MCPHPPLLVPTVASGAAAELDDLRAACWQAIGALLAARPDVICILGAATGERWYGDDDVGSFRPYGVPLEVPLGAGGSTEGRSAQPGAPPTMPLSLTVGAWLLHAAGWAGRRSALGVPGRAGDADLDRLAADLPGAGLRVGLLVMADGTARRSEKAPGYVDPRAAGFDRAVAAALGRADTAALAALDQPLGDDLLAAGTATWRLLGRAAAGIAWDADLLAEQAPYGVGYFVAAWSRRP